MTHTVHRADSALLECWCVISAIPDQQVSNKHRIAIRFEADFFTTTPVVLTLNLHRKAGSNQSEILRVPQRVYDQGDPLLIARGQDELRVQSRKR